MVAVVAFWALAVVTVGSALLVVLLRNVFHAALFLVLSFAAVAGLYVMLNADFLAAVQILLYVGAIAVLLIFGIMLTQDVTRSNTSHSLWPIGLGVAGLFLVVLLTALSRIDWPDTPRPAQPTAAPLADALFSHYLLPFELASVLLLAAIVGAIVIAKER